MGLDLTFCHETPLNTAIDIENKLKGFLVFVFVFVFFFSLCLLFFIILSCWCPPLIIWIFVSFVRLIVIVSENRLNFFDRLEFSRLKMFVSTFIRATFFQSFLFSWWVFKIPLKKLTTEASATKISDSSFFPFSTSPTSFVFLFNNWRLTWWSSCELSRN